MEVIRRRGPISWLPPLLFLLLRYLDFSSSLNDEGMALLRFRKGIEVDPFNSLSNWIEEKSEDDPCSWRGIKCEDGKVAYLNLNDLHLKGTLAPEIGQLSQLRYLILRNNCFHGIIPKEIGELRKIEVIDLAHNDLTGPIPSLANLSSLQLLSIGGNPLVGDRRPELHDQCASSCDKVNGVPELTEGESLWRRVDLDKAEALIGGLPQAVVPTQSPPANQMSSSPPPPSASAPESSGAAASPPPQELVPPPVSSSAPAPTSPSLPSTRKKKSIVVPVAVAAAVSAAVLVAVAVFYYRSKKGAAVKPWATGLSGQLQKALVTGVAQLRRSELEAACEDFSNVIGELPDCTLYKGTLSSGVEIAVAATVVNAAKDWSTVYEDQFRKKIATLSKVSHKNFSSLLGYCEENEPFTRMMVFEYASNGTLHEHLHVREGEDLDWQKRMRIAMGVAYCLDHMHQCASPIVLGNLQTDAIYLTEDFAAKISDFEFWSPTAETAPPPPPAIVYKFGMLLLEIIAGQPPVLAWAPDYLKGLKPVSELIDPNLKSFKEEDVAAICELVVRCCNAEPLARPAMAEVAARLREITGLTPDATAPKSSPLWWAELEIAS